MAADPTGVAIIARIFERLLRDDDCTASSLAQDLGLARATTYDVVRQLDRSGFIDRGASGRIGLGQAGAALGFAALGLSGLTGAAEALLPVLRDDTDASVDLVVRHDGAETLLVRRMAPGVQSDLQKSDLGHLILEQRLGGSEAWLRLYLRPHAGRSERTAAKACLESVAAALSRTLEQDRC